MAENTKNRPRPSVAGMLRIAKPSPRAIPSCTMITGRQRPLSFSNVVSERVLTHQPTPVVTSRPRNIHRNAWVRKAVDSTAAGRTPSCDGDDGKPYWFIEIPLEAVASLWVGCSARWGGVGRATPPPPLGADRCGDPRLCLLGRPGENPHEIRQAVQIR